MDKITTEVNVLVIPVEIDLAIVLGHTVLIVLLILPTDFLSHTARTRSGQSGVTDDNHRKKATIDNRPVPPGRRRHVPQHNSYEPTSTLFHDLRNAAYFFIKSDA